MNLLLDTHTTLWFIHGDSNLSNSARELIDDPSNDSFVSIASIWEIAIKVSVGKMTLMAPFSQLFPLQLNKNGFDLLQISIPHTSRITALPFHHRDPLTAFWLPSHSKKEYH